MGYTKDMKLSKTNAKKILAAMESSKKKVFTCDDLSKKIGIKVNVLYTYIEEFYSMILLDPNFNLREIESDIRKYISCTEKNSAKKRNKRMPNKEYKEYSSFIDYVYKNMTIAGGILDTGYVLNAKDKRMLKYYLNKKK